MIFSARQLKIRREMQNVFSKQDCKIARLQDWLFEQKKKQFSELQKIREMVKSRVNKLKIHADAEKRATLKSQKTRKRNDLNFPLSGNTDYMYECENEPHGLKSEKL